MSHGIDEAQVRHIAKLARLRLSDDEVRVLAGQLGEIIEYVRQLESAPTEGVEPLAHALPISDVLREDTPQPSLGTQAALANAPDREGPYFKVPAVLDPGAGA